MELRRDIRKRLIALDLFSSHLREFDRSWPRETILHTRAAERAPSTDDGRHESFGAGRFAGRSLGHAVASTTALTDVSQVRHRRRIRRTDKPGLVEIVRENDHAVSNRADQFTVVTAVFLIRCRFLR
jgi:hypothetical protein